MAREAPYTRRELLRGSAYALGAAALGGVWLFGGEEATAAAAAAAAAAKPLVIPPSAPVAIARCDDYERRRLGAALSTLEKQMGGLKKLVAGKTVTVKVNITGSPMRWQGRPPGETYQVHPAVAQATVALLADAGAKRVRIVESAPFDGTLEAFLTRCGWDIRALQAAGPKVEFENTRNLGKGRKYVRVPVPGGGQVFPAYDLNHSYADTDILVSLSKLKAHVTAGVTVSLKNLFGITPSSLYGDDAGGEDATEARSAILHNGWRNPPSGVPKPLADFGHRDDLRVPRIVVELARARPIDLCVVDGVFSVAGGEGPWQQPLRINQPRLLLMGRNPVCVDAVATAVMGYDPLAKAGTEPFSGENHLALAAAAGLGTNDPEKIDVRGLSVKEALCPFGAINRRR